MENSVKHGDIRILICTFFFKKKSAKFSELGIPCMSSSYNYIHGGTDTYK